MKVRDLLEMLEDYDEDLEVLVATQPGWPLQFVISHVASLSESAEENEDEDEDEDEDEEPQDVVYLIAIDHPYDGSPYAPRSIFGG